MLVAQAKGNRLLTLSLVCTVRICQADSLRAYLRGQMPEAQVAHAQFVSRPVMDIGHTISMHIYAYIFRYMYIQSMIDDIYIYTYLVLYDIHIVCNLFNLYHVIFVSQNGVSRGCLGCCVRGIQEEYRKVHALVCASGEVGTRETHRHDFHHTFSERTAGSPWS